MFMFLFFFFLFFFVYLFLFVFFFADVGYNYKNSCMKNLSVYIPLADFHHLEIIYAIKFTSIRCSILNLLIVRVTKRMCIQEGLDDDRCNNNM